MNNKIFQYNGNPVTFQLGSGDIMVNATEMAKSFNKQPIEYLRLPSTVQLLEAYMGKSRISKDQLVTTKQGSSENGGGTWLHEDIAIDFAQWLSIEFKLWCNDRIKELLRFGITATQPTLEQILNNPDLIIMLATQLKTERAEKEFLTAQNQLQSKQLEESAVKVDYVNKVLTSKSTYITNQIAKELGMSAITLNKKLKGKDVQYKQGGQWLLKHKHQGKNYTRTQTYAFTSSTGETGTNTQTVWTEKGRLWIHELMA